MRHTLLFIAFSIITFSSFSQDNTPTIIIYDDPALITPAQKDTVKIFVSYADTSWCKGTRKDSRGRTVTYLYQCDNTIRSAWAYGVRLKNDACELVLSNDYRSVHQFITFFAYLDQDKKPMHTKFIVLQAILFKYEIRLSGE